jgi:ElaA protein
MTWTHKPFNELTATELYNILRLRSEVFVVEQNCVFLDMDNKDAHCEHLMAWGGDGLLAYARIVPPGISYAESSIGRIVTSPKARGQGIGMELVKQGISLLYTLYGRKIIRIGAQLYLKRFYNELGFTQAGDIYLEDGIEHIEMVLLTTHAD